MGNEFFSAGLWLMLLGSIVAYLRWIPGALRSYAMRRYAVTVEVHEHDPAFQWMTAWLSEHMGEKRACGEWTISTCTVSDNDGREYANAYSSIGSDNGGKKRRVVVDYAPAPGWHFLRYQGKRIVIHRIRTEKEHGGSKGYVEHFILRTWGKQGRDLIQTILEDGRKKIEGAASNRFHIYQGHYQSWENLASCTPRPLASLVLEDGIMEALMLDIEQFLARRAWYVGNGIPYRRGYGLFGEPGNGKSSLVSAIAGHFGMDIYVAPISSSWMDDINLSSLMRQVPENAVLLMEDIDCAFPNARGEDAKAKEAKKAAASVGIRLESNNSITLSGLLNVIDGIAAPEGRLLFMTSNHPEVLDPAILRKGRIDKTYILKTASDAQARQLYKYFYRDTGVNGEHADRFAARVAGMEDRSMAALQGLLLEYPDDPHAVLESMGA